MLLVGDGRDHDVARQAGGGELAARRAAPTRARPSCRRRRGRAGGRPRAAACAGRPSPRPRPCRGARTAAACARRRRPRRAPPRSGARASPRGRRASSPASRAQPATKRAISPSPAPPGTSAGLTESIATSREVSSMTSACMGPERACAASGAPIIVGRWHGCVRRRWTAPSHEHARAPIRPGPTACSSCSARPATAPSARCWPASPRSASRWGEQAGEATYLQLSPTPAGCTCPTPAGTRGPTAPTRSRACRSKARCSTASSSSTPRCGSARCSGDGSAVTGCCPGTRATRSRARPRSTSRSPSGASAGRCASTRPRRPWGCRARSG